MWLVTTDLHLTDKPSDHYRFGLFNWLHDVIISRGVTAVFILGDLTDRKDKHSAELVNTIVGYLVMLAKTANVIILTGNHDYVDPQTPFFGFTRKFQNTKFVSSIDCTRVDSHRVMLLPHSRDPLRDWEDIPFTGLTKNDYVFLHQTFDGARASNGIRLDGLSTSIFKDVEAKIYSGDIHVPQNIGKIAYVGAPYHIRFGDVFNPRVLLLDPKKRTAEDLFFPCLKKHVVKLRDPERLYKLDHLNAGDQVKVRLSLTKAEFTDWEKLKRQVVSICSELELVLYGIELEERVRARVGDDNGDDRVGGTRTSPTEIFEMFCDNEKVDDHTRDVGRQIIEKDAY